MFLLGPAAFFIGFAIAFAGFLGAWSTFVRWPLMGVGVALSIWGLYREFVGEEAPISRFGSALALVLIFSFLTYLTFAVALGLMKYPASDVIEMAIRGLIGAAAIGV